MGRKRVAFEPRADRITQKNGDEEESLGGSTRSMRQT